MSVQAISAAFATTGLSPSEKLLLLALANYAGPKMTCFPSHSTLAEDTGMSERNILRIFKQLEARGLVSRKAQKRGNRSRTSDLITLHFDGDVVSPGRKVGGDMVSGGVGTNASKGGDMVSPPEPIEPLIEPARAREPCGEARPSRLDEAEMRARAKALREATSAALLSARKDPRDQSHRMRVRAQ